MLLCRQLHVVLLDLEQRWTNQCPGATCGTINYLVSFKKKKNIYFNIDFELKVEFVWYGACTNFCRMTLQHTVRAVGVSLPSRLDIFHTTAKSPVLPVTPLTHLSLLNLAAVGEETTESPDQNQ